MIIVKETKNLRIYAGDGMSRGLFFGENKNTGKISLWNNTNRIQLKDCIY